MNTILRRSLCLLLIAGCGVAPTDNDRSALSTQRDGLFTPPISANAVVTASATSITLGSAVTATYAGLDGTPTDWIALAVAGSPDTSFESFAYANGTGSGSVSLTPAMNGSYVLRAYNNNSYVKVAESAVITVGAAQQLTTNASTYQQGETITVNYTMLPGNPTDWVAIATQGSPNTSYLTFQYITATSGTLTFTAPAAGTYEIRAFVNNTYELIATSAAFTVTGGMNNAMVTASATTITLGSAVTATYAGLAATSTDWIALAVAGSPDTSYESFAYTNGTGSGSLSLTPAMNGSYVLRAFNNNSFLKVAESAVITVGAAQQLTTNASSYQQGETVTVNYTMLPGNPTDWVAIAVQGSPNTSYLTFQYITATSGTLTFTAPAAGTYEVRAFVNNTYELIATSSAFTVAAAPLSGTVTTANSTYPTTASITANYSALPGGGVYDWVTIAPAGSALGNYGQFIYVPNGQTSGSVTFNPVAAGSYVIRVFSNNTFTLLAESSTITVQEPLAQ